MHQQHCKCNSLTPGCCPTAGESPWWDPGFYATRRRGNYAPIEGEALAAEWALEDSRFFSIGC